MLSHDVTLYAVWKSIVVSIGLFWVSFMPFSYSGVYFQPLKAAKRREEIKECLTTVKQVFFLYQQRVA